MTNAEKLAALSMVPELAKEVDSQIAGATPSDADIAAAIAAKTEIAALTPSSTAADIVAALQA